MILEPTTRAITLCQELVRIESLSGEERAVADAGEISAAHAVDESVAEDDLLAAFRGYQALARGPA